MSVSSGPNYSVDNQISFIVQWFRTWSELQKDDFVEILAERLAPKQTQVNGLVNGMQKLDMGTRRVSLFSCQVKLFNEWWQTWSQTERENLTGRLKESDPKFWAAVQEEINGTRKKLEDDFFLTVNTTPMTLQNGAREEDTPSPQSAVTIMNGNRGEEEEDAEEVPVSQQNGVVENGEPSADKMEDDDMVEGAGEGEGPSG